MLDLSKTGNLANPRRYLALWFPFLPTDRHQRPARKTLLPAQDEAPLALVQKQQGAIRLFACNRQAVQLGLCAGLSLADARARCPDLTAVEADEHADQSLLHKLADFCERFTPLVAFDQPYGLMLDITGCAHLFGGETAMRQLICNKFRHLGFHIRASIAGSPGAARIFARFSRVEIADMDETTLLSGLPVEALEAGAETHLALRRAGLSRIGDLAARPSAALASRFGENFPARLRRILGLEEARIIPLRPLPECMVEQHFPEPLLDDLALSASLKRLLDEMARALERRGQGGRRFELQFFRSDGAVRHLVLETGRPSRDPDGLLRLYREKLEILADPIDPGFGFDAVRLSVPVCEPFNQAQVTFDKKENEYDNLNDLIDRLVQRFGRDNVTRFVAQDSQHPDRQYRMVSVAEMAPGLSDTSSWTLIEPDGPPRRPLHVFDPPQPIEAIAEVPDGPPIRIRWRRMVHEITRSEGPERIAPEWWHEGPDMPTRDYYRIEDAKGARFWVFRNGLFGEQQEPRWFLHGLFA